MLRKEIIFVADQFVEDYACGGAELTTEALIETAPFPVRKIHSEDVTSALVHELKDRYWIFGNFFLLDPRVVPDIIEHLSYSVLEYDYKFCKWRSTKNHELTQGTPCACEGDARGVIFLYFLRFATTVWWMSRKQMARYHERAPMLSSTKNVVLSSVFSRRILDEMRRLRLENHPRYGWVVLASPHWIKNAEGAAEWCRERGLPFYELWGVSYEEMLQRFSKAEGLVYLPLDNDTCPRMVIEAKLLGCKLELNEYVQHADEEWFATEDLDSVERYLRAVPDRFWSGILSDIAAASRPFDSFEWNEESIRA